jgi:hypothetical protein
MSGHPFIARASELAEALVESWTRWSAIGLESRALLATCLNGSS